MKKEVSSSKFLVSSYDSGGEKFVQELETRNSKLGFN